MKEVQASQFFDSIVQGTDKYREITLEQHEGYALTGVKMHAVDKRRLASVIERLPDEMFSAVEGAEDPDQAEAELEEEGGDLGAVTEDTVDAFEDLVGDSLDHPDLTASQVNRIAEELDFETLFRLGTEIINMSVEDTGRIRDFHERE